MLQILGPGLSPFFEWNEVYLRYACPCLGLGLNLRNERQIERRSAVRGRGRGTRARATADRRTGWPNGHRACIGGAPAPTVGWPHRPSHLVCVSYPGILYQYEREAACISATFFFLLLYPYNRSSYRLRCSLMMMTMLAELSVSIHLEVPACLFWWAEPPDKLKMADLFWEKNTVAMSDILADKLKQTRPPCSSTD